MNDTPVRSSRTAGGFERTATLLMNKGTKNNSPDELFKRASQFSIADAQRFLQMSRNVIAVNLPAHGLGQNLPAHVPFDGALPVYREIHPDEYLISLRSEDKSEIWNNCPRIYIYHGAVMATPNNVPEKVLKLLAPGLFKLKISPFPAIPGDFFTTIDPAFVTIAQLNFVLNWVVQSFQEPAHYNAPFRGQAPLEFWIGITLLFRFLGMKKPYRAVDKHIFGNLTTRPMTSQEVINCWNAEKGNASHGDHYMRLLAYNVQESCRSRGYEFVKETFDFAALLENEKLARLLTLDDQPLREYVRWRWGMRDLDIPVSAIPNWMEHVPGVPGPAAENDSFV